MKCRLAERYTGCHKRPEMSRLSDNLIAMQQADQPCEMAMEGEGLGASEWVKVRGIVHLNEDGL